MNRPLKWAGAVLIAFTSCAHNEPVTESSPEEQVNEARENVNEAKDELKDAKQELREEKREENFADDKQAFANEMDVRIKRNEEAFAEMRWDLNKADNNYEEKNRGIETLEKRNRDFKRRVNEYEVSQTRERREEFKREIRKDMDALEHDIKEVFDGRNGS